MGNWQSCVVLWVTDRAVLFVVVPHHWGLLQKTHSSEQTQVWVRVTLSLVACKGNMWLRWEGCVIGTGGSNPIPDGFHSWHPPPHAWQPRFHGRWQHCVCVCLCLYCLYYCVSVVLCVLLCLCVSLSVLFVLLCLCVCLCLYCLYYCVSVCVSVCTVCTTVSLYYCVSVCVCLYCLYYCVSVLLSVCERVMWSVWDSLCLSVSVCLYYCVYVLLSDPVCVFVRLCLSVLICLCVTVTVSLSMHLCVSLYYCVLQSHSVCLCRHLSVCLSVCPTLFLYNCLTQSVSLCVCVCLCYCLFITPSVYVSGSQADALRPAPGLWFLLVHAPLIAGLCLFKLGFSWRVLASCWAEHALRWK